ncbi:hypothetical protein BASA81_014319 [Batrachochytrium salamandrivorans]|nr:hypothetical protein BASA81_014319 [Batrachochytrium salamandrivorans]
MTYGAHPLRLSPIVAKSFLAEGHRSFRTRETGSDTWPPLRTIHRPMVWLKECTLCSDMDSQHLCMESETAGTNISLKFSLLLEPEPTRCTNSHRSFSCSESIRVSQLTKLHRRTLWLRLTTSNGWKKTPSLLPGNLEEKSGQARSAANVRTKAQAEAMRKRTNFDETTPDYFFKVGDMVKMKHHDRLKL